MYNFDEVINRRHTNSLKWDLIEEKGYEQDILPMWVADMDFKTLPDISHALEQKVKEGIFGYTKVSDEYYNSIIYWMKNRHNWEIKKDWIVITPGIVTALKMAVNIYTQPNDCIIIQKPVYYPFDFSIELNHRVVIENPMRLKDNQYELDLEDFEKKIIDNNVKMYILCNPHNPIGKVWTKEELKAVGDICKKHNVLVISDEIHHDFVYNSHQHIPFYSVDESYKEFSIVCTAPSKTFNLAGLQVSNIIIANESLRKKFIEYKEKQGIVAPNIFAIEATIVAYTKGEQWVNELVNYLYSNIQFMKNFIKTRIPQLKIIEPQGLYLVWVDFTALNMSSKELEEFMIKKAKLWLDEGYIFGTGGECFERFNIACPRETLKNALLRLEKAINEL